MRGVFSCFPDILDDMATPQIKVWLCLFGESMHRLPHMTFVTEINTEKHCCLIPSEITEAVKVIKVISV